MSFDVGVGIAAVLFLVALPAPGQLLRLLSASGLAAISVLICAVMPYSLMTLHGRVMAAKCSKGYRRVVSFAVKIVGIILVLGMWFVVPYNLGKLGLAYESFDSVLFVLGCIAILAGTLAAFDNLGAAITLGTGAVLLGVAFGLPADLAALREGAGPGPVVGIAIAVVAVIVLGFTGRYVNRLDELSNTIDAWLAKPSSERTTRLLAPFLLALAFSIWSAVYADLTIAGRPRLQAIMMLVVMGVVPYRILLVLVPPLRPLPVLTGVASLTAWMVALFH